MSKRADITDGLFATTRSHGLVYTEELGWLDLGHAQGNDAHLSSPQLKARIALTIMYGTAKRFEAWQDSVFFQVVY